MGMDGAFTNRLIAREVARTTLRSLGAGTIKLRMCAGGQATTKVEGIGLVAPAMDEISLESVLVRTGSDGAREVIVDSTEIELAVGTRGEDLKSTLLLARVDVDGRECRIVKVSAEYLGGAPYLYRLGLED